MLAGDGALPGAAPAACAATSRSAARRVQRPELDELRALAVGLDGSYLFVQGPPGSGKTYRGARIVTALLRAGKRVGVAAQSHKVIHNLLDEVERAAREEGLDVPRPQAGRGVRGRVRQARAAATSSSTRRSRLIAGTSWLFSREELDGTLDALVIDEAGQISLADALAMGTSARSLILLGDPLQLAQVTQGVHPPGSGASVLEHLLGEHDTIPEDRGVFLEQIAAHASRGLPVRLRGVLRGAAAARSRSARSGRRRSASASAGSRSTTRATASSRRRRRRRSPRRSSGVLAGTFTEAGGERPLRASDVMVVAPYNAQVRLLRERLPAGVEVGTVDKFQGREAAVVFYSMASSSGEDVPRGLDFLLSRNRLNVAVSRAQCLAYVVCSPRLLEVDCRTIEQMRLANALCRFVELAQITV